MLANTTTTIEGIQEHWDVAKADLEVVDHATKQGVRSLLRASDDPFTQTDAGWTQTLVFAWGTLEKVYQASQERYSSLGLPTDENGNPAEGTDQAQDSLIRYELVRAAADLFTPGDPDKIDEVRERMTEELGLSFSPLQGVQTEVWEEEPQTPADSGLRMRLTFDMGAQVLAAQRARWMFESCSFGGLDPEEVLAALIHFELVRAAEDILWDVKLTS